MILIRDLRLFDGEDFWPEGCVVVDGTRVAFAGDRRDCPLPPEGGWDEILNGRGDLCLPGLVNAHTHAAMALLRGLGSDLPLQGWLQKVLPVEARMMPEDVGAGTTLAVMEMLSTGTTAFADMYFHLDAALKAVLDSGIRANVSRGSSDAEGVDSHRALHAEWDGAGEGRVRVFVGLHAEYTSGQETAARAAALAMRLRTGLHTHVSETRREVEGCLRRHGKTPVRYFHDLKFFDAPVLAAHCVHLLPGDIALLAQGKAGAAHCPASNLKLASGVADLKALRDGGVRVALGTDGPASNNTLDMFREMRLASLLQKGTRGDPAALGAREAVRMATREGALALGFEDVGLLRAGMRADLVLLDARAANLLPGTDPVADIVYAACGGNVRLTMVNGRVLYEDGEYTTIDAERARRAAAEAAARLSA